MALYRFAEREGFEPSVQLPVQRFSRPSHSTTLASLQITLGFEFKQTL